MSVVPNWRENWIRKEKHFVVGKKNYITLWERCKEPQRGGVQKCYSHDHPVTWKQMSHCQEGGGWMGGGQKNANLSSLLLFPETKVWFSVWLTEQKRTGDVIGVYFMSSFLSRIGENWTLDGPRTSRECCLAETRKKIVSEDGLYPLTHIHCNEKLGI